MRPRIGRALDEASALSDAALAERWLTQLAAPPRRRAGMRAVEAARNCLRSSARSIAIS